MYANDIFIIMWSKSISELIREANLVIKEFSTWCNENRLIIMYARFLILLREK